MRLYLNHFYIQLPIYEKEPGRLILKYFGCYNDRYVNQYLLSHVEGDGFRKLHVRATCVQLR